MPLAQPHPGCSIEDRADYIRAEVRAGNRAQLHDCYRTVAELALKHKFGRVLIVGAGGDDAHGHLGARDAVVALNAIGVPAGFRLAFVAASDPTLNGYRHAEIEARKLGLRAQVFRGEADAVAWLTRPDVH